MNEIEEFEFWCAEYRDNPDIAASETLRLLIDMCKSGNFYALSYSREIVEEKRSLRDEVPDVVDLLEDNYGRRILPVAINFDDMDGEQWGILIGAVEPRTTSSDGDLNIPPYAESSYPANWSDISNKLKNRRAWRCEECKFQRPGSALIQVHHIDRDKSNNEASNLQVLCAACHGNKHGGDILWPTGATAEERAELVNYKSHRPTKFR